MTQLTSQSDRRMVLTPWARWAAVAAVVADYYQLAKPRLTLMVVITAFIGYAMGLEASGVRGGQWSALSLMATILGTALSCIGAGVFNQIIERHIDSNMQRTMHRPLPAGRMTTGHATIFASICCAGGVVVLAHFTHLLSALLAATCILSYVLLYTPMKRLSSVSTIVGAIPGALPPMIGFAAATGTIEARAWMLFAILFLWQLPHFLAIAWLYREDYAQAGLEMLPAIDHDGASTFRYILLGCLALLPLGLMPALLGISGVVYFFVALGAGVVFLIFGVMLVMGRTRWHARALFFASLAYLPVVFTTMWMDRI